MEKYNVFYNYDELMYYIDYHEILENLFWLAKQQSCEKSRTRYFESADHFFK